MAGSVLKGLSLLLVAWIGEHSNYNVPESAPEIQHVTQAVLASKACNRNCAIRGWYPSNQRKGHEIIYLVKNLNPAIDLNSRGILLHELVHYVQDYNQAFINGEDSPKVVFAYREMEANRLENLYKLEFMRAREQSRKAETGQPKSLDLP